MAQSTTARPADEGGEIQARETTRTNCVTEEDTDREGRAKETAASRSGKVRVRAITSIPSSSQDPH